MLIFHVFQEMTVKMPSSTQEFHKLLLWIYGSIYRHFLCYEFNTVTKGHFLCYEFNTVTKGHLYLTERNDEGIIQFTAKLNNILNLIFIL